MTYTNLVGIKWLKKNKTNKPIKMNLIGMVEQEYWRFGWTKSHWWRWHSKWFWAKQWISMVWRWNYITGTSITQIYRQSGQHFISWLVDIPVLFVQTTELDTVVQHRHTTAWQTWVTNQMLHACHCNKSRSCVFFLCLFTLHSVPTVRIYSEKNRLANFFPSKTLSLALCSG